MSVVHGGAITTLLDTAMGWAAYTVPKAERELGYVARVSYEEAMSEIERDLAQRGMLKR